MNTLITSLHINYQPKLDIIWALREIGSNAIDGEERNRYLGTGKMSIEYSKRTSRLTVSNEGVVVPQTALLMGMSESRGDDSCIGQFGEGLPMALLVLARNNVSVTVYNGAEKWEPVIERNADYRNEPVLCIRRRKLRTERKDYTVEIDNITPEMYAEFCNQYLKLDADFDANMVATSGNGRERILLQPRYYGKIYNKGVFVCSRKDLLFGYDLHGELNRDRSFMDEWTLKWNLGHLLTSCSRVAGDKFVELLTKALVDNQGVLEVSEDYGAVVNDAFLSDRLAQVFVEKYGSDAVAVESEEQAKEAKELGFRGVMASPLVRKVIDRKVGSLTALKERAQSAVQRKWSNVELTSHEASTFNLTVRLVQSAWPAARKMNFEVVSIASPAVRFLADRESKVIRLNRSHMMDFEGTLASVIRGVVTVEGTYTEPHVIMAKIISQMATGSGNMDIAMAVLAEA